MKTTDGLGLKITTDETLGVDRPDETIVAYGENFKKIENKIGFSMGNTTDLNTGELYPLGHIIWNSKPTPDGYVGWVNTRQGVYAHPKVSNKTYQVGDLVTSPNDTGVYYECIRRGTTPNKMPMTMNVSLNKFNEVTNKERWRANYIYTVDEVVFATDGTTSMYYQVTQAGTSGSLEPKWNNAGVNTSIVDGSVTWKKLENIQWERKEASCQFLVFGKIGVVK